MILLVELIIARNTQRKRNKPKDASTATGTTAADATQKMLEKKKFSKKINYDAIKNLFDKNGSEAGSTYAGSDEEEDGGGGSNMLLGQEYGSKRRRKASKRGTPIKVPTPTFGSRASSRAPSELRGSSVVGSPDRGGQADEEEPVDDENDWRQQFGTMTQEEDYGFDEV